MNIGAGIAHGHGQWSRSPHSTLASKIPARLHALDGLAWLARSVRHIVVLQGTRIVERVFRKHSGAAQWDITALGLRIDGQCVGGARLCVCSCSDKGDLF
jgi:hypothetical protein